MKVIWRDWRYGKDNWGEIPHKQGYCIYLEERKKARQEKDFAKSDEIRDKLTSLGYKVIDTKEGQKLEKI